VFIPVYSLQNQNEADLAFDAVGNKKDAPSMETSVKLNKRLEIMRAAGAIADFRITQTPGRAVIEIEPSDSLEGEELHDFVAELMGSDRKHVQIVVVAAMK